jgi:hypothetical protein
MNTSLIAISMLLAASPASAQLISVSDKFAWAENVGYLNWGDTPSSDLVIVTSKFLSGRIWGENIGWISLGDGNGDYDNTNDTNYGVNRSVDNGHLSGYAWGENVGWINFAGGSLASPPNPARFEDGRFRGYAWGENIGWINLDDTTVFVALTCAGDIADDFGSIGADGEVSFGDFLALLGLIGPCPTGVGGCLGDIADDFGTLSGDGQVSFGDFLALLGLIGKCP